MGVVGSWVARGWLSGIHVASPPNSSSPHPPASCFTTGRAAPSDHLQPTCMLSSSSVLCRGSLVNFSTIQHTALPRVPRPALTHQQGGLSATQWASSLGRHQHTPSGKSHALGSGSCSYAIHILPKEVSVSALWGGPSEFLISSSLPLCSRISGHFQPLLLLFP